MHLHYANVYNLNIQNHETQGFGLVCFGPSLFKFCSKQQLAVSTLGYS